jgi:predicted ATPase
MARALEQRPAVLAFGPFKLDLGRRLLTKGGEAVPLGGRALDLLIALTERPGELITKAELMARAWPGVHVEEAALRVQISGIRRALGEEKGSSFIAADAGRGYRFVAPLALQAPIGKSPVRRLPARLTTMFGRDADVAAITQQLRASRLMTIVGPGGIGKTTLALACAEDLEASLADGVVFAEVTSGGGPEMAVAAALGLRFSEDTAIAALTAFIAPLELLVVLDGCEFAVEPAAQLVEAILRRSPNSVVLCTSRESLRAEGEVIWRIAPLAIPAEDEELSASEAMRFPAIRLFVGRASAADQRFSLTDADVGVVSSLCRRLDGLPLAIELAASNVAAFGLRGVQSALDNRFQKLLHGRRTAVPRHRTLAAAIDWSFDQLSGDEQRVLRSLSLFQGPFDADDALHLALDPTAGADSILAILSNLVAKSLVVADPDPSLGGYRLLDSTRAYAREKLEASGELNEIAAPHATRTMAIFSKADTELDQRSMEDWLRRFSGKLGEMRAALDWACAPDGDRSFIVPLTLAAIPVWVRLTRFEECQRRIDAALTVVEPGSRENAALEIAFGNVSLDFANRTREGVAACERAIELADRLEDTATKLKAIWGLWNFHISSGRVDLALDDVGRLSEQSASPFEKLIIDRAIGVTELLAGNLSLARHATDSVLKKSSDQYAQEVLKWYAYDPNAMARNTFVSLLWLEGKPDSAIAAGKQNLAHALVLGNDNTTPSVLTDAACGMAIMVGDDEAAERYLTLLDSYVRRGAAIGFRHWAEIARAALAAGQGHVEPGLALLAGGFYPTTRHPRFAILLTELAENLAAAGAIEEARRFANSLLQRVQQNGELWILSEVQRIRSQIAQDDGEARSLMKMALVTAREQGAKAWELRAATSLARRWPQTAASVLAPVLKSFTEGYGTRDLVAARQVLSAI